MGKKTFLLLIIGLVLITSVSAEWYKAPVWEDQFNDGVINNTYWNVIGAMTETNGFLQQNYFVRSVVTTPPLDTIYNWNGHHSLNTSNYFQIDVGLGDIFSWNTLYLMGQPPTSTSEHSGASLYNVNDSYQNRFGYTVSSRYTLPTQNGSTPYGNCPDTFRSCTYEQCNCMIPNQYGSGWTFPIPSFSLVYNESGYFLIHHTSQGDSFAYGSRDVPITLTEKLNYLAWGEWSDHVPSNYQQLDYVEMYQLVECQEEWLPQYSTCAIDDTQILTYTDNASCGTYYWLPTNNGTSVSCNYCELDYSFSEECVDNKLVYTPQYENYETCCNITGIEDDCNLPNSYNITGCWKIGTHQTSDITGLVFDTGVEIGRNYVAYAGLIVLVCVVMMGLYLKKNGYI